MNGSRVPRDALYHHAGLDGYRGTSDVDFVLMHRNLPHDEVASGGR